MALNKRAEAYIVELLRERGPLTSNQLADLVNARYKHGCSAKDIGRNLSKSSRFRRLYSNNTWKLKY